MSRESRLMRGDDPRGRARRGTMLALALAGSLGGAGCNAVLGIDEAELCSAPECDVPDFVQGRTQANQPAAGARDAGVGDAGSPDPGVVNLEEDELEQATQAFIEAVGAHRHWQRETDPPMV